LIDFHLFKSADFMEVWSMIGGAIISLFLYFFTFFVL